MGSVLSIDQKLAETRVETVETTATRSYNLSANRPPSQDLQRQVSETQPVLAPSQIRTGKGSLLPTECKPEGAQQRPSFVICPPATNLQLSSLETETELQMTSLKCRQKMSVTYNI